MLHSFNPQGSNTVCIFEDDTLLASVMSYELHDLGYNVHVFSDTNSVGIIKDLMPTLIILDLNLHHADAIEVLKVLSEDKVQCPVQLISGSRFEMLDRVKQIGERRGLTMLPVLQKPFAITNLLLTAGDSGKPVSDHKVDVAKYEEGERHVELDLALDQGWVEVWYQPKYDMKTLTLVGAECLCRIRHPDHGIMGPATFLPKASMEDLRRLTEFILQQSCEDWTSFEAAGRSLRLAINIPCALLTSMPLVKLIRQWRPPSPDWPGLILEVTEEQALRDIDAANEMATQLAIYGIDLSIDDFGTGYSSLSRLREIVFQEVKLDRSLVAGCVTDETRGALCRAIIELSHALGAATVAEGIENGDDLAFLRDAGCDTAQGYLLARPMTRDGLLASMGDDDERIRSLHLEIYPKLVA